MALKLHRSVCFIEQVLIRLCILQVYHRKHLSVERLITLAFFQGFLLGGEGAKSIIMQISIVMLIFLLLSDQTGGKYLRGGKLSGGRPLPLSKKASHPV